MFLLSGCILQQGYQREICTPDISGAVFQSFFEPACNLGSDAKVGDGHNVITKTQFFTAAVHYPLWI